MTGLTDVTGLTDAAGDWSDLIGGERWRGPNTLWVEDGTEYSAEQVGELAAVTEAAIRGHQAARGHGAVRGRKAVRVVRIRSWSKLGCFAGQLAAWRAGCVAVADDGTLGPAELDRVRPDLALAVRAGRSPAVEPLAPLAPPAGLEEADGLPDEIIAVNFTSGSTGSRKAVGVTRGNLLALFGCRDLDVPPGSESCGRLAAGSFAAPGYDGWWFDTWRTVAAGGTVVCLPNVNEDVFEWPELAAKYHIDRLLLPAAVLATLVDAVPACIADIPWLFSGGEQFQAATVRQARRTGLTNQFVNLYGPTEATFATHKYELPAGFDSATIPIGQPIEGCEQTLRDLNDSGGVRGDDGCELVVGGPLVCLGYLDQGTVVRRFEGDGRRPEYRTGDVVRADDAGNLMFAGRLDHRLKVNGIRVDAAALEHQVSGVPGVLDCRVAQNGTHTVAFVRGNRELSSDGVSRSRLESVVRNYSPAIKVNLVGQFPMKSGGKVDTAALMNQHYPTGRDGEK
jgi:acyl-coenzyme A synthetase/AMP-(fatty) acid ligase